MKPYQPSKKESLDGILDVKVVQRAKGYRFSSDPVVLASFILPLKDSDIVLDIGTGSGIIPLILSGKTKKTLFYGIEIQKELITLAEKNTKLNRCSDRIKILEGDFRHALKDFKRGYFSVIVSNPPYGKKGNCRVSPRRERAIARCEIKWSIDEFIETCCLLLDEAGRVCLIYPVNRFFELTSRFKKKAFYIKRVRFIHPRHGAKAGLFMMEAVKERSSLKIEPPVFLTDGVEKLF